MSKILKLAAVGTAAYLLRNKESRDKVMNKIQSAVNPETINKIKTQFQSFTNGNSKSGQAQKQKTDPFTTTSVDNI